MKEQIQELAQLYWQCWDIVIEANQWTGGRPSEETYRAATACVFIEANKRGMSNTVTTIVPTHRGPACPPEHGAKPTSSWRDMEIHFGKNKGIALGGLAQTSLRWYIEKWQPQPYKGLISKKDKALRAALDQAKASLQPEAMEELDPF